MGMRRIVLLLASMTFAVLLVSWMGLESNSVQAQESPRKPNVVLLLTDDLRSSDLKHMPNVKRLLANEGTAFNNFFTTVPTCCPSRVSFLRGQYAHNHKVAFFGDPVSGASGEISFRRQGHDRSTVATWARSRGYRTGYFGKYLNFYRSNTYVPPGWTRWYANTERDLWANTFNSDGQKAKVTKPRHEIEGHLFQKSYDFVNSSAGKKPFFLWHNFNAPHNFNGKSGPPARAEDLAKFRPQPLRTPAFNERDVSDKPPWIASSPRLTKGQKRKLGIDQQRRLASLQEVDRSLAKLVRLLEKKGQLKNTYIFFTSDNGYHMGEHRLMAGKMTPYIGDVRVPLIVRGPGVAKGIKRQEFVENVDFAPTVANIVGAPLPDFVDGRSLVPVLRGENVPWRQEAFIEGRNGHAFTGLSTTTGLHYVEYREGPKELYDLYRDPYQLDNLLAPGRSDPRAAELANRLRPYVDCAGEECRR
jgi:N-acetylglucosamine-6-sulfatase